MVDMDVWLGEFRSMLEGTFGDRIEFIGLQGSYSRGEATDKSDIDVVVVLDKLQIEDLYVYDGLLDTLPFREKLCGFISGKSELLNWEPSDLFHLYFDTKPIKGALDFLFNKLDHQTINRAVRIGTCNIYHACVHNLLHEKDPVILKNLYKSACFVIQTRRYQRTGKFVGSQSALLNDADHDEKEILNTYLALKSDLDLDFQHGSETLFLWAGNILKSLSN